MSKGAGGWSEEEIADRRLMAPCGLYCGVCGVYISTRDDNEKFRARLGELYGTPAAETRCHGCMQPDPPVLLYAYCRSCPIRECVQSRGFCSCASCAEWPCALIRDFPLATAAWNAGDDTVASSECTTTISALEELPPKLSWMS